MELLVKLAYPLRQGLCLGLSLLQESQLCGDLPLEVGKELLLDNSGLPGKLVEGGYVVAGSVDQIGLLKTTLSPPGGLLQEGAEGLPPSRTTAKGLSLLW